jgi:hypothetical protein
MMRQMRRRWRARKYEAALDAPFDPDAPPWANEGPEQWAQEWTLPRVEDGGAAPAGPAAVSAASPPAAPPLPEVAAPAPAPAADVSAELVRVLEVVTTMCGHVIEFVEAEREERRLVMQEDREERRAIIEALSVLIARIGEQPALPAAPRERVIGGSMPAGPEPVLDLRELEPDREVCCRFGDQWLDGFEICEKVEAALGVRYRLRRRTDGAVLPELFAAADIRHADAVEALNTFDELSATAIQQGNWSPAFAARTASVAEGREHGRDGDHNEADA